VDSGYHIGRYCSICWLLLNFTKALISIKPLFQLTVAFNINPKATYYHIVAHNDGEFIPLTKSIFGNDYLYLPNPLDSNIARLTFNLLHTVLFPFWLVNIQIYKISTKLFMGKFLI